MTDLTTLLGESLERINQLAQRSDDLRSSIALKQTRGAQEFSKIQADQGQLQSGLATARGALTKLEGGSQHRGQATQANLDQCTQRVEQLLTQMSARQTQTRQRIAALRQALLAENHRLEEAETRLLTDLEQVRLELCSGMDRLTQLLNESEHDLSQTVIPAFKSLEERMRDRAQKFQAEVETQLLPRIDTDVKHFAQKLLALAQQLAQHFQAGHETASRQAAQHSEAFHKNSGTDWRSGPGDVEQSAAQRAASLNSHGQLQSQAIHGLTQQMATLTGNFEQMMQGVVSRYSTIHGLPAEVDVILHQAGL
ncbi:MAG: hypothetical protein U0931_28380 [Vulcanimicrobiota bacterium]